MLLEFSVPMRKSIFLYLLSPRCYYFLLFIFHCSLYRFVVMSSVVYFIFTFTLSRNHYVFATHSISLPPHSLIRSLSHNPYISLTTQQTFLWLLVSRTKLEVSSFHLLIFFLRLFSFHFYAIWTESHPLLWTLHLQLSNVYRADALNHSNKNNHDRNINTRLLFARSEWKKIMSNEKPTV